MITGTSKLTSRINPPTFSFGRISGSLSLGLAMLLVLSSMACSGADDTPPTPEDVTTSSDTVSADTNNTTDTSTIEDDATTTADTAVETGYDHTTLLTSVSENVITPMLQDFQVQASELHQKATAYTDALSTEGSDVETLLADLRASWKTTMDIWQEIELVQFGPAGVKAKFTGGEGIRDEVYSWPSVNPCRVDQEIVEEAFATEGFFSQELVNVYGLDTLEYLVFYHEADNNCSSLVKINENGTWAEIEEGALTQRRALYASTVTKEIMAHADNLVVLWTDPAEAFTDALNKAGTEGSIFETSQKAMDELFAALFTLDTVVKDKKLAIPLGINTEACASETCVEDLESRWAHYSKENVIANLKGFQRAFLGGDPPDGGWGFDDALIEEGSEELAAQMKEDIQNAIDVFEAMPGSLLEHIENGDSEVQDGYAAVKKVTDNLKGDMPIILKLEIPKEAGGDSD